MDQSIHETFPATHKRFDLNQQALRTLCTNGSLLLSRQERSERTSPNPLTGTPYCAGTPAKSIGV
jgi:hypothetical protein